MPYSYMIRSNKANVVYYGSCKNLEVRYKRHLRDLKAGKHHNPFLQAAWDTFEDVELGGYCFHPTVQEALEVEQFLIDISIGFNNCCNIGKGVVGGDNITRHPSRDEIVAKIKTSLDEKMSRMSPEERKKLFSKPGERNGMWKRKHSKETRELISARTKGRVSPNAGKEFSEETKLKLSQRAKERVGVKNPFHGKKHTAESLEKMSRAKKGVPTGIGFTVKIGDDIYPSYYMASVITGIPLPTIRSRCMNSNPKFDHYQVLPKCPETIESTQNGFIKGDE